MQDWLLTLTPQKTFLSSWRRSCRRLRRRVLEVRSRLPLPLSRPLSLLQSRLLAHLCRLEKKIHHVQLLEQ